MSGIYIHIPYCKQACHYCDFHFSTNLVKVEEMISMMVAELKFRKDFFHGSEAIKTIYFGGGTPSLLGINAIETLLNTIYKYYDLQLEELTLEANPDDLEFNKLKDWKSLGIDRLSIGVQSFNDKVLKFYNRAHNRKESLKAISMAEIAGFEKISIDLIYGFPHSDHSIWKADLELALDLNPGHVSSYSLTIEPKTAFGTWLKRGEFKEASEEFQAEQFEMLMESMEKAGYMQYEISNFGQKGKFAVHNTNYWKGIPYLGIGPSAHSFDGKSRGFNISNNALYIKNIKQGVLPYKIDDLSDEDIINEYILTSLRTMWGCDLIKIKKEFSVDLLKVKGADIKSMENNGLIKIESQVILLTNYGKLLADSIAASLFL